jgi:hypothetical protein
MKAVGSGVRSNGSARGRRNAAFAILGIAVVAAGAMLISLDAHNIATATNTSSTPRRTTTA